MKKIETIWHYLLYSALKEHNFKFTQKELAKKFDYSLSTINYSLTIPTDIGAIRKESKFFILENFEKLLYYWASVRNFSKDLLYSTYLAGEIKDIQGQIPAEAIFAGYTAASYWLKEPAADYDKIYCYMDEIQIKNIKERFLIVEKKKSNIFFLKKEKSMDQYGSYTTIPQTFVDIWNMPDWYAQDFLKALKEKINGILS